MEREGRGHRKGMMAAISRAMEFLRSKTSHQEVVLLQEEEIDPEGLEDELEEVNENLGEIFVDYVPRKVKLGHVHPGEIVETGSLASVEPPDVTYVPAIQQLMEGGEFLSSLQMEAIIYASQRHQVKLCDGSRGGFFLGDGAGVGKGRTIAGLLLENWLHDRKRALWISASADLSYDARRDLQDAQASMIPVYELKKLPYGPIAFNEGVVFLTYSALISKNASGNTRLLQLTDWLGQQFDGLVIFDESHRAKNLLPEKHKAAEPTQSAVAVVKLQVALPNSRVLYCSATGATEPRNMGYMIRLGLWGQRDSGFENFEHFLSSVTEHRLSVLEMVAMEMKARGMYLSRSLSYRGAEFEMVEVHLTDKMKSMYKKSTAIWHELFQLIQSEDFLEFVEDRRVKQVFWAAHQRFFRSMCIAAKVPAAVSEACKALSSGNCVVIGLQSTGEARMQDAVTKERIFEFDDLFSGPQEILKHAAGAVLGAAGIIHFSGRQRSRAKSQRRNRMICYRSKDDTKWIIQSSDSESEEVCTVSAEEPESQTPADPPSAQKQLPFKLLDAAASIMERINSIELPLNPLDDIIDRLSGSQFVAEMTGRTSMIVRRGHGAFVRPRNMDREVSNAELNLHERNMFQSGKKIIAIISEAASTGISLQADKRAGNQLKRVHITLELPWSADRAMQQLGRTHRSNQTSNPSFRLLITNLGGESRFAAAVARRLESMGALTQGDRRAGPVISMLSAYNFHDKWGEKALCSFFNVVLGREEPRVVPPRCLSLDDEVGINSFRKTMQELLSSVDLCTSEGGGSLQYRENGKDSKRIPRFLNRLLGLAPEDQQFVFSYFTEVHKEVIRLAKLSGHYDAGVSFLQSDRVTLLHPPRLLMSDRDSGCNTLLYSFCVDRGISWEKALEKFERHNEALAESKRLVQYRRRQVLLDDEEDDELLNHAALVPFVRKKSYEEMKEEAVAEDRFGSGFYLAKTGGRLKRVLLALENRVSTLNTHSRTYQIFKPHLGLQHRSLHQIDLEYNWQKIDVSKARALWEDEFKRTEHTCLHRLCQRPRCQFGMRVINVHIVSGVVLQLWHIIQSHYKKGEDKVPTKLNVVRFEYLDKSTGEDGIHRSLIGIHVDPDVVSHLEESIRNWKSATLNRT